MLSFMFTRFRNYRNQKQYNSQWDDVGRRLYELAVNRQDRQDFVETTRLLLRNSIGGKLEPRPTSFGRARSVSGSGYKSDSRR
jgi:hypothetical protein